MSEIDAKEIIELLTELEPFVRKALPVHKHVGGEADRQLLLKKLNGVLARVQSTHKRQMEIAASVDQLFVSLGTKPCPGCDDLIPVEAAWCTLCQAQEDAACARHCSDDPPIGDRADENDMAVSAFEEIAAGMESD